MKRLLTNHSGVICLTILVAFSSARAIASGDSGGNKRIVTGFMYVGQAPSPGVEIPTCSDSWNQVKDYTVPRGSGALNYYLNVNALLPQLQSSAVTDIDLAFQTWNQESNRCGRANSSNFSFADLGLTTHAPSLFQSPRYEDDLNEVDFVDFSTIGFPVTALAATRLLLDPTLTQVIQWDIVLNTQYVWGTRSVPGTYDIWNTVAHEVGIPVGLFETGDVSHGCLTMFDITWPGDIQKRNLALGDSLGLEAVSASR